MRPVMEGIFKGLTKDQQQDARQQRRVEVYVCNKNRQEYSRRLNLAMVAPTLLPIKGCGQTNHSSLVMCTINTGGASSRLLPEPTWLLCCDSGALQRWLPRLPV